MIGTLTGAMFVVSFESSYGRRHTRALLVIDGIGVEGVWANEMKTRRFVESMKVGRQKGEK